MTISVTIKHDNPTVQKNLVVRKREITSGGIPHDYDYIVEPGSAMYTHVYDGVTLHVFEQGTSDQ